MADTKVQVTFTFTVPSKEIADIDIDQLKKFIKFQIGMTNEYAQHSQFSFYELSEFSPKITQLIVNNKERQI